MAHFTDKLPHRGIPMFTQRVVSLLILLAVSPVLIIAALLIRAESRGPVFFRQVRIGELGRQFYCYKLRSMRTPDDPRYRTPDPASSDREGVCKKFKQDPRITFFGRWMRKFSIDELPQLINVVRGDMALVGPRPHLKTEYLEYNHHIAARLRAVPGLTGLWQVNGRADTNFDQQLAFDFDYIRGQNFWLDMKILIATIPAVVMARGAY